MALTRRVERLTPVEARALLGTVSIGRVVFADRGLPAVLPVTFLLEGDAVFFRTAEGSRLARAGDDEVLTFQADMLSPASRTGWSVVVTGNAEVVTDPSTRSAMMARLEPWVPGIRDVVVRIPLTVVQGRRITAH
ncbi:pyridoxamine 5'-phosphate oxidase family protein [Quadrisphaera sp. GCM10027208]|uniref:pyridoxamine 5'-phosphate oxidase family protein n=1 Tax=Quadrisphaera sp. GCM10027208 TaxID=3273423 RepID=UPI0036096E08